MNKQEFRRKSLRYLPLFILVLICIAFAIIFNKFVHETHAATNYAGTILKLLSPFIIGLAITFFLTPAVRLLETGFAKLLAWLKRQKKLRLPARFVQSNKTHRGLFRVLSMTITYIVIFGLLVLILVYVIPQLGASINSLFVLLSNSVTDLVKWIKETAENWDSTPLSSYIKAEDIANYATTQLSTALNVVQDMIRNFVPLLYQVAFRFANGFINFVVGVIISIYLIYNRESAIRSLKRMAYAIFKKSAAQRIISISSESMEIFRRFFIGKAVDSFIIGLLCFIFMRIFRMPYAELISFIVGITNMIPYFGPFIGAIPSALIIFMTSPMAAIGFAVMIVILQQFDGNVLGPAILGGSLGLKPFWIIFAVIIGGGMFGVVGMLLGVPIFTVLYTLVNRFILSRLHKKGIQSSNDLDALEQERLLREQSEQRERE